MLAEVKKTISIYNMLIEGDSVLVGLSGGPDSVCLLYVLREFAREVDLRLFIAHLNHGLRGKESDRDEEFCKKLGESLDIPVFTNKVKIKKSEDEARRVRYEFLEEAARRFGAKRIALGHNADDQVETVLMRLLRGAGVKGLGGIPPVRKQGDLFIIRPLINVWREEILDYVKKRNIPYRVDSTNLQLDFFRNKIRHELLPFLSKYNPNIKNVLQNTGRNMAMLNEYIESLVEREIQGDVIDIKRLNKLPQIIRQEVIRKIVGSLSAVHIDNILALAGGARGSKSIVLPKGMKVVREYDKLIFSKEECVKMPDRNILLTSVICKRPRKIERNPFEVYLDYDKVSLPLIMRNRRPGDVFQPIGFSGTKKVKDIFIDQKIPERLRDKIPIVVSGKEICWIPGYRIGERFKIGSETKRVVKISAKGVKNLWQS